MVSTDRRPFLHRSDRDLQHLVDGLSTDRREAFVLTQLLGFSYEDAAQAVSCPVGTIRSRVARARAGLIAMVEPVDDEATPTA